MLFAAHGMAATLYVSDELVLGVYAEQSQQATRLATLHSGASVETLESSGEFTKVSLSNGITGWVKTSYLTTRVPASMRVKELEDELARSRATTPALAEAAEHSEVLRLKRELAAKQSEMASTREAQARPTAMPGSVFANPTSGPKHSWLPAIAALLSLALGFGLGYATLARRIKHQFGGIKIY